MKKSYLLLALPLLAGAVAADAAGPAPVQFRLGAQGGVTAGGNVGSSAGVWGLQGEYDFTSNFGLQASFATFNETKNWAGQPRFKQSTSSLGFSLVGRLPVTDQFGLYGLAGFDYNMIDADNSVSVAVPVSAAYPTGGTARATLKADSGWGEHLGLGFNYRIVNNWEVFTEYRYTFFNQKGRVNLTMPNGSVTSTKVSGNNDFGTIMLGVNYTF
ncbi:outer membrane beta-barrel protein [uncultured Thiodictyon sp.]|uniref:outer membrane protein n=1 Tax=uncultured Thiodictyon sp. TaxID=1846217 RepID=UPI0025FDCEC1|nr:outer membrane beta-barrel protein [uncultured Thiodictyon sp.]